MSTSGTAVPVRGDAAVRDDAAARDDGRRDNVLRRLSTETKASFKTTEFFAYLAMLVGLFVAGAITKAGHYGGHHDVFRADRVWLYATVLTIGYMVSRGIASPEAVSPTTSVRRSPSFKGGRRETSRRPPAFSRS